jgi:hypothetical protein
MANTFCRSSFPGASWGGGQLIDCSRGVAPERMPKADATGLAPKKSADYNPPAHDWFVCGRVWLLLLAFRRYTPSALGQLKIKSHFFGEVSERRPLGLKREDRPAVFAGRSESQFCLAPLRLGYRSCLHKASILSHLPAPSTCQR